MTALSRFNNLKVSTKISVGFASVLAIATAVAFMGTNSLANVEENINQIAQRVLVADLAQSTENEFLKLRRQVREYALTGSESYLEKLEKNGADAKAAVERAVHEIKNPERLAIANDIAEKFEAYKKHIDTLIFERKDLARIIAEKLDPAGAILKTDTELLVDGAIRSANAPLIKTSTAVLEHLMLARLHVNKHIGQRNEASLKDANDAFAAAEQELRTVQSMTTSQEMRGLVDQLASTIAVYRAALQNIEDHLTQVHQLVDVEMRSAAEVIAEDTSKLVASAQQEEKRFETETFAAAEATRTTMIWLSVIGIAIGTGLAWFISTSISGPVRAVANVLRSLAEGNLAVVVPYADRGDEVGENARSAQFFKEKLLEAERLRQEQAKAQADRERRQVAIETAVRKFESEIARVIGTVTEASDQLEKAAVQLTHTAGNTQQLSTAVAAASEQTSANVQGVAAASEELAATVNEISRQVQESSQIAERAVGQARSTNSQVTQLSDVANRIGDVVNLINNIAGQTNLLALNATIEAARAGEAGKGFAVVAQEVKALAMETGKATNEISAQISSMQVATHEAVAAIHEISTTIDRMSEISGTIAAAVEEQDATTREISRNVLEAAKGTSEVASNVTDVSHGASETGAASQQVLSSAKQLARESDTLKREVTVFLDAVRAA